MPYSQNPSQIQIPAASGQQAAGTPIPRNVSFAKDSSESTAYREHNPPTVLRRQGAARRELSPTPSHATHEDSASDHANFVRSGHPSEEYMTSLGDQSRSATSSGRQSSLNILAGAGTLSNVESGELHPEKQAQQYKLSGSATFLAPGSTRPINTVITQTSLARQDSAATSRTSLASSNNLHAGAQHTHPHTASEEKPDDNKQNEVHILVAVTGSVATIKLPQIVHKLKQIYRKRAIIQVVVTRSSTTFFDPSDLPRDIKVWHDSDEWRSRQAPPSGFEIGKHSDQQLHIKLRRWADILLVAPCSANTLAKFTYGICDNLLTSIFRVWNPDVPIILAPAMNTHMYTNPVTKLHFNILKEFYPFVEILKPVEKVLVCGDIGMGGMREWTDIVQILVKRIGVPLDEDEEDEDEEDDPKNDHPEAK